MTMSIRQTGDGARLRQMEQLAARQQRRSQRLASGRRIATAADDPAGLAIARRLEAAVRGAQQGERNVRDGQSLARTAEGALQTSHDTVARMRELSVQAQNGTLNDSDRQAIQQEYDQLAAQLDQTAGGTSFAGRALLDGSASGGDAIVITDGAGGDRALDLPDVGSQALGVAGRSVADPSTIRALDDAGERLAGVRARLGAADSSFGRHAAQLAAAAESAEAARSRIEDADFAREVAEQTRDRILRDLQLAGQRHANGPSRRRLDLIG